MLSNTQPQKYQWTTTTDMYFSLLGLLIDQNGSASGCKSSFRSAPRAFCPGTCVFPEHGLLIQMAEGQETTPNHANIFGNSIHVTSANILSPKSHIANPEVSGVGMYTPPTLLGSNAKTENVQSVTEGEKLGNKNPIHQNSLLIVVAMESLKVLERSSEFPALLPQFLETVSILDFHKHGFVRASQICFYNGVYNSSKGICPNPLSSR